MNSSWLSKSWYARALKTTKAITSRIDDLVVRRLINILADMAEMIRQQWPIASFAAGFLQVVVIVVVVVVIIFISTYSNWEELLCVVDNTLFCFLFPAPLGLPLDLMTVGFLSE